MANAEHLAILLRGVEAWNLWREKNPRIRPDLCHADLTRADLDVAIYTHPGVDPEDYPPDERGVRWSADPYGVNFKEALLRGAHLGGELTIADLTSADLTDAQLTSAELRSATLRGTCLKGAELHRVHFYSCEMANADLSEASLSDTLFSDVDLSEVRGLDSVNHVSPSIIALDTLVKSSGTLPAVFLRGCGFPEPFILNLKALVAAVAPIHLASCFISYSSSDEAFARKLYSALQEKGIRCWLDKKDLRPGDDLYDSLDRAIRLRDKFLLCCSQQSLTSWWVDNEIGTALEKEQHLTRQRGRKAHVLIPLNLDGYMFNEHWQSGYRAEMRRRVAADFVGWSGDNAKFEEQLDLLIEALRLADRASNR